MDGSSHTYKTEREFLDEFVRRVRHRAQVRLASDWHEPYSDADMADLLDGTPSMRHRTSKRKGYRTKLTRRLMELSETQSRHLPIEGMRRLAKNLRNLLGIQEPVPIAQLKRTMEAIGHPAGVDGIRDSTIFACPFDGDPLDLPGELLLVFAEEVQFRTVSQDEVQDANALGSCVRRVSARLSCHPALALAFLLCDTPIESYPVTAVVEATGGISVSGTYRIPVSTVSEAYTISKMSYAGAYLGGIETPRGNWRKPRDSSLRVHRLVAFVEANRASGWQSMQKKWNRENPSWRYSSLNSMRTVYYRATTGDGKDGGPRHS